MPKAKRPDYMGLGGYMQEVARVLHPSEPINYINAFPAMTAGSSVDRGYAAAVLVRLAERNIARELFPPGSAYIRGPEWEAAAEYYGWKKETAE